MKLSASCSNVFKEIYECDNVACNCLIHASGECLTDDQGATFQWSSIIYGRHNHKPSQPSGYEALKAPEQKDESICHHQQVSPPIQRHEQQQFIQPTAQKNQIPAHWRNRFPDAVRNRPAKSSQEADTKAVNPFYFKYDFSGYGPDELQVVLDGKRLIITGEHRDGDKRQSVHRTFKRILTLPPSVLKDTIDMISYFGRFSCKHLTTINNDDVSGNCCVNAPRFWSNLMLGAAHGIYEGKLEMGNNAHTLYYYLKTDAKGSTIVLALKKTQNTNQVATIAYK
ncbi:hypothetical protein Ddc_21468 [Ditylenchus destructor]|nr:hypothetical protein Ddc_21468 [Ditylenchus destructor]